MISVPLPYAGNERIGIDRSKRELYRWCIDSGHRDGEFLICGIEEPWANMLDELPDV